MQSCHCESRLVGTKQSRNLFQYFESKNIDFDKQKIFKTIFKTVFLKNFSFHSESQIRFHSTCIFTRITLFFRRREGTFFIVKQV